MAEAAPWIKDIMTENAQGLLDGDSIKDSQRSLHNILEQTIDQSGLFKTGFQKRWSNQRRSKAQKLQEEINNYCPPMVNKKCGAAISTDDTIVIGRLILSAITNMSILQVLRLSPKIFWEPVISI